jgi:heavy metal sensor kinase
MALMGITLSVIGVVLYLYIEQSSYERLNTELRERTAEVENTLNKQRLAEIGVRAFELPTPTRLDTPQIYIQFLRVSGEVVPIRGFGTLPVSTADFESALAGQTKITNLRVEDGTEMLVLYTPIIDERQIVYVMQTATPLATTQRTLDLLRLVLVATGLLALSLVGFGAWWTTGSTLGAVDRIATTARRIESSQDLNQRIPDPPDAPDDEMTRLVRTFNNMLNRLDAAFQAQKQFVADSSHELRSPLTVIQGNLDLWRKARNDAEREEVVSAIEQETARMTRLVENLLLLAQMESTPRVRDARQEEVELDSLLLTVYQQARVIDNHTHQIILAHEDAVTVHGQRDQLQQLLLNLVDNAIKYTPAGGTISLGLYGDEQWARLEVADTGPGIPAADLPNIFDRFYRSDKARSRVLGGAGLGLAIVREVVDAHGGQVAVESTVGQGTLFRVWLPRPAHEATGLAAYPAEDIMLPPLRESEPTLPAVPANPPVPIVTSAGPMLSPPLLGRTRDDTRPAG